MSKTAICSFTGCEVEPEKLIKGIIKFDNLEPVYGSFQRSYQNVTISLGDKKHSTVISSDVIPKRYIPNKNGIYVDRLTINIFKEDEKYVLKDGVKSQYEYSVTGDIIKAREEYVKSLSLPKKTTFINYLSPLFNKFSVGIEFETDKGLIPKHELLKSGLVPLRDGSIGGFEYVTIPLQGDLGAFLFSNAVHAVGKYTEADKGTCALHFHFGGVPRTEEFIVALWRVMAVIQNDLFAIQPPYKMLNWGFKKKSYSEPYPAYVTNKLSYHSTTRENFSEIFEYLSQGTPYSDYNCNLKNVVSHPSDPEGRHKWNIKTRYSVLNLVPLIFGNKKTVEFRLSEISTNPKVITSEMVLFATILNFVMTYEAEILKNPKFLYQLNLPRIISEASENDRTLDYNMDYYSRKVQFYKDYLRSYNGDEYPDISNVGVSVPGEIKPVQFKINPKAEVAYFKKHFGLEPEINNVPEYVIGNFGNLGQPVREANLNQAAEEDRVVRRFIGAVNGLPARILTNRAVRGYASFRSSKPDVEFAKFLQNGGDGVRRVSSIITALVNCYFRLVKDINFTSSFTGDGGDLNGLETLRIKGFSSLLTDGVYSNILAHELLNSFTDSPNYIELTEFLFEKHGIKLVIRDGVLSLNGINLIDSEADDLGFVILLYASLKAMGINPLDGVDASLTSRALTSGIRAIEENATLNSIIISSRVNVNSSVVKPYLESEDAKTEVILADPHVARRVNKLICKIYSLITTNIV